MNAGRPAHPLGAEGGDEDWARDVQTHVSLAGAKRTDGRSGPQTDGDNGSMEAIIRTGIAYERGGLAVRRTEANGNTVQRLSRGRPGTTSGPCEALCYAHASLRSHDDRAIPKACSGEIGHWKSSV
eukprot:CAMPEP_0202052522 /NCGR_PEP_ID=MMETSP0963-20130614/5315_1 /ASSEMBLY_ACC=CAM_ASM_000494 /TAXON_ID=4773 /ORGANISM="Schizochytrium aggregatum, Strain ATCC28209" /LENGTH=125 /DNA_ID=CAMNT_0048617803 /DNA_START=54 /DNA_END=431 /DNA_ORIENTATION=-